MIHHIIIFKFKANMSYIEKENIVHLFDGLLSLDVIYEGEVYLNDQKADQNNDDLYFHFVFKTWSDLNSYQNHPDHLALKQRLKNNILHRSCIDYEDFNSEVV